MSDASKVGVGLAIIWTTVLAILVMATLMAGPASAAHCKADSSDSLDTRPLCEPGHVRVDELPASPAPVEVQNFPTEQPVTVQNFPAIQDVNVVGDSSTPTTSCAPAPGTTEPAITADWTYSPPLPVEARDPDCAALVWSPGLEDLGFDLRRNVVGGVAILIVLQAATLVVAMRR